MIGVVLEVDGEEVAYGPFADGDRLLAERFAAYLTAEVDPARLVFISELLYTVENIPWRSPLIEVLNWRDMTLRRLGASYTREEAVEGICAEMERFAVARQQLDMRHAAGFMSIREEFAETYERTLSVLLAALHSEAAPVAPGAAPDPLERNHHA